MKNKTFAIIIFGFILLTSCGPAWHLKQAKRHELIAISKGGKVQVDTFYKVVKIRIKESVKDTLFVSKPGDTIRISKDLLKLVYIDLPGDSVYLKGKCDSVVKEVRVPVTVTKVIHGADSGLRWYWLIVAFAAGLIICFFSKR